ncbi:hypothetical protein NBRGN_065_00300 [Nocardia brasiliensis NBRC 14402]|nr:hypothetical protein NBRGN_065_00300 [Nocardia brasiliensis NBRC 14402]
MAVRRPHKDQIDEHLWSRVTADLLAGAAPWRTFRWRHGQKHYSGTYWSATEASHVIYESRLELSRLLIADFDRSVKHIVAQPFLLRATVDRKLRKHIPDYLLLTDDGPVVVDVKPRARMARPAVQSTFAWTRELVESVGWRYEVANEAAPVMVENVRFLAGYRRPWLFAPALLAELRNGIVDNVPFREACSMVTSWPAPLVRSAILHLMWVQHFGVDVTQPLNSQMVLVRREGT